MTTEVNRMRVMSAEPTVVVASTQPTATRRSISWGAIFAGVMITLVMQLALGILGLGIGAGTINPVSEANPVAGMGTGAGIWFAVSTLIALFTGGYVAGRMAGIPRRQDGLLHGLLSWSLSTLLLFYLLTTTIGGLIGGAANVLGRGLSAVGTGVVAAAPAVTGAASEGVEGIAGLDLTALQSQLEGVLGQVGMDTSGLSAAISTTEQLSETMSAATDDPQSRKELGTLINRIATSGNDTLSATDRTELLNFMTERGGRTPAEAEELVASFEQTYQEARAQYQETLAQAEQSAREAGQAAAEGLSSAAIWTFIGLLLGAVAAAAGGYLATPRRVATQAIAL